MPARGLSVEAKTLLAEQSVVSTTQAPFRKVFEMIKRKNDVDRAKFTDSSITGVQLAKKLKNHHYRYLNKYGPSHPIEVKQQVKDIGVSLKDLMDWIQINSISVDAFAAIDPKNMSDAELDRLYVLNTDLQHENSPTVDIWKYITLATPRSLIDIDRAVEMCNLNSLSEGILGEGDFAFIQLGKKAESKVGFGAAGFSDMGHKFHACVFVYHTLGEEDEIACTQVMGSFKIIVTIRNGILNRYLKDMGAAVNSATILLRLISLDCLQHVIRGQYRATGQKRGYGSLILYVWSNTNGCLDDVGAMIVFVRAMRHLPSKKEWIAARKLFIVYLKESMFRGLVGTADFSRVTSHVIDTYFKLEPGWGSAARQEGESQSIQGVEKGWDWRRKHMVRVMENGNLTSFQTFADHVQMYRQIHPNGGVQQHPPHKMADWVEIEQMCNKVPPEYFLSIYYDAESNHHIPADDMFRGPDPKILDRNLSFEIFIPTPCLLNKCITKYDFLANPSGHSAALTKIRTTNWYKDDNAMAFVRGQCWLKLEGKVKSCNYFKTHFEID